MRNFAHMEGHLVVCSVAAFSFLSSALYMYLVRIPNPSRWKMLVNCRILLMMVFLVVGLSCAKNVIFPQLTSHEGTIVSTLISASIQSLLFVITSVTFLNPSGIKARFILFNAAAITLSAAQLLLCKFLLPNLFYWSAALSVLVYLSLWLWYQFRFYAQYRQTVAITDSALDEYSEGHFKWVKQFFIGVSVIGLTACVAPFCSVSIYDAWMLLAALCYGHVVVTFVRYFTSLSILVSKTTQLQATPTPIQQQDTAIDEDTCQTDFDTLKRNLQEWVDRRGYVQNDLVSDDLARQLGVSVVVFRAYFRERKNTDFRQWRMKKRIEYACEIIRKHPDYSYDVIANLVGIGDRSNFTKAFKRIKGITPKEFSEELGMGN